MHTNTAAPAGPAPAAALPATGTAASSARPTRPPAAAPTLARRLPGIALAGLLAAIAVQLAGLPALRSHGIGALTVAILAGMLAGHVLRPDLLGAAQPGIDFAKQTLLRLGVALYGLRLTLADVQSAGLAGLATDTLVILMTITIAGVAGPRLFGIGRRQSLLIGSGAAICGAAAVLATAPVLKARAGEVAIAIATVVCFGTLAIGLYPLLHGWIAAAGLLPGGDTAFGFYLGSTVHEVAQVIAAAEAISPEALDAAVVAKLVRVMMLAPFLLGLAFWLAARPDPDEAGATAGHGGVGAGALRKAIPWFALGFLAMAGLNSTGWLATEVVATARTVSDMLLATAMAALGLTIRAAALRAAGPKPMLLAALIFAALVLGGGLINRLTFGLL